MEISYRSEGVLLEVPESDTVTSWTAVRPDGMLYSGGHGIVMGAGGERATFVRQGRWEDASGWRDQLSWSHLLSELDAEMVGAQPHGRGFREPVQELRAGLVAPRRGALPSQALAGGLDKGD